MRRAGAWKTSLAVAMALCLICCVALAAWALSMGYAKSGVAIVELELTEALGGILPRQLPKVPDFVDPVKSRVKSTVNTALPDAVSRVRTAANSVATHVSDVVDMAIPKTFYVGTRFLCVGDLNAGSCHRLPLRLSDVIPVEAQEALKNALADANSLNDSALSVITAPHIRNCLIAGVVSVVFGFLAFLSVLQGWCSCLFKLMVPIKLLQAGINLLFGLMCCLPFMMAVGFQVMMQSVLPAWISFKQGDVFGISVGCLCCGCALALLGSFMPFLI